MRSGTRNRSFVFAICTLISACALYGDQFLIGYRLSTHNASLISDRLSISRSMTPCQGDKGLSLFLPRDLNQSLSSLLASHEDEFIEFAMRRSVKLKSNQNIQYQSHLSIETLTVPTECYDVDFYDDSVIISPLN